MTLRLPVTLYKENQTPDPRVYVGAHVSLERLYWPLVSSLRFGPEYFHGVDLGSGTSKELSADKGFAGSVQLGLLGDKVAMGVRLHNDGQAQQFISVNDINGTLYWAIHMALNSMD